jgi:hypothetical protein
MDTTAKKNNTVTKDKDELETKPVEDSIEEPNEEIKEEDDKFEETKEIKEENESEEPKEEIEPEPKDQPDDNETIDEELGTEPEQEETKDPTIPTPIIPEGTLDQVLEVKEDKPKSNKGLLGALAITLVVGGSLTGGIIYSRSATNNQDIRSKAAETPEITATATPTATPTPEEIDFSEYSIEIQNGSGTAGQAGVVNEILQAQDFSEADTTNADSYDYEDTEVQMKEGTPKSVYNAIEKALTDDYQVIEGEALDADSLFDIVVIVGAKR